MAPFIETFNALVFFAVEEAGLGAAFVESAVLALVAAALGWFTAASTSAATTFDLPIPWFAIKSCTYSVSSMQTVRAKSCVNQLTRRGARALSLLRTAARPS